MKHGTVIGLLIGIIVLALLTVLHFQEFSNFFKTLIPKPESFTELYFEDHLGLPTSIPEESAIQFSYTIHNQENKDMTYPVQISIQDESATEPAQILEEERFSIKSGQSQTVFNTLTLPKMNSKRAKISVDLKNIQQHIHFWVNLVDPFGVLASPSATPIATESSELR